MTGVFSRYSTERDGNSFERQYGECREGTTEIVSPEILSRVRADNDRQSGNKFSEIIGSSSALGFVISEVKQVAPTDSTVLILGETGTGKELIAKAIHNTSKRCGHPLIKVNCAAIPFDLLESELFGHEKGAFTGAIARKVGRFELADKGTLFLDEIGDIPLALQPKLLRVLQEQEFERLGGGRTHRINVRLVAATHRDLEEMVTEKDFRSDLYYRLNVFPVSVPPLRERREDIPLLVLHFVEVFSRRMGKSIDRIPEATMDALMACDWPGNVRELQNLIERAVIRSDNGVLSNPLPIAPIRLTNPDKSPEKITRTQGVFLESERALILHTLWAAGGMIGGPKGAAARLGLKRTTLISKMQKHGIYRTRHQGNESQFNELPKSQPLLKSAS